MTNANVCDVCRKSAPHKCGGCQLVYYCSKEHQKIGWKTHKRSCRAFKVCENEILGRHLVATRPIKSGEVILNEVPIVQGPSQDTLAVCLGCMKKLTAEEAKPCTQCGWPMCSQICQNSPNHIPECSYTTNRGDKVSISTFGIPHPTYNCILVLRCLYQKQFLPEKWKKMETLESHCEQRKANGNYDKDRTTIVPLITKFLKISTFTEEEILKVCGIIMVNGHEVPLSIPSYVSLYGTTSLFEHSCMANCTKSYRSDGNILIHAGVDIKKGDHLSICYTDPIWGTANRRYHLQKSKFFWCKCIRCNDPSEFGTNFNSIKCQNSCDGCLLPKSFVDEDLCKTWICKSCGSTKTDQEVSENLDKIGMDLMNLQKNCANACTMFIERYKNTLHPNHYYMTDLKITLIQIIGQEFHGGLLNVSDEDLHLKQQLTENILGITKKIAPSEKRLIGILLFELHSVLTEIERRKSIVNEINKEEFQISLLKSRNYLREVIELLKYEPKDMPEGKVCDQARLNLEELEIVLRGMD